MSQVFFTKLRAPLFNLSVYLFIRLFAYQSLPILLPLLLPLFIALIPLPITISLLKLMADQQARSLRDHTAIVYYSPFFPLSISLSASHFFHSSFAPSPPRSFPLGPKTPPSPLRHYHISPKVSSGVIAHITKTNASLPLRPSYFSPQNKRGRCFMLGSAVPRPFNPERDVSSAS